MERDVHSIRAQICWVGCDFFGEDVHFVIPLSVYMLTVPARFSVTRQGKVGQLSYGFE